MASGLAPTLLADREAVALQGRAERAGACDTPLTARTAAAVTIPLSFASHAKAQRCRREQEIGRMSRGSTPSGRHRQCPSLAREPKQLRRRQEQRPLVFGAHQFAIDSKSESERFN